MPRHLTPKELEAAARLRAHIARTEVRLTRAGAKALKSVEDAVSALAGTYGIAAAIAGAKAAASSSLVRARDEITEGLDVRSVGQTATLGVITATADAMPPAGADRATYFVATSADAYAARVAAMAASGVDPAQAIRAAGSLATVERHRMLRWATWEASFIVNAAGYGYARRFGGPGWFKILVATFDNVTGTDSLFVHLQERPIDRPFEDNRGHLYQHPPNRPWDREVVLFEPRAETSP